MHWWPGTTGRHPANTLSLLKSDIPLKEAVLCPILTHLSPTFAQMWISSKIKEKLNHYQSQVHIHKTSFTLSFFYQQCKWGRRQDNWDSTNQSFSLRQRWCGVILDDMNKFFQLWLRTENAWKRGISYKWPCFSHHSDQNGWVFIHTAVRLAGSWKVQCFFSRQGVQAVSVLTEKQQHKTMAPNSLNE